MPKKSDSQHENRGRSSMQGRGQKANQEEGPGNANNSRQQIREDRLEEVRDTQKKIREEKSGNRSDYRQQIREKKLVEGAKAKNGCLPKLFVLVLPFMAVATFLLFRS